MLFFLRKSKWRLSLGSLDRITDNLEAATQVEVKSQFPTAADPESLKTILMTAYKCELMSRQGRILLQMGALEQVGALFERAKTLLLL